MEFWDRVNSLPEECNQLVDIRLSLNDDGTIWLGIEPIWDDTKKSADAMIKFLLDDFILTGIAMVKDVCTWDINDWVRMMDDLMELWENHAAWWKELSKEEKIQILSKDDNENDIS